MSLRKILQAADKAADEAATPGPSIPRSGNQQIDLNGLIWRVAGVSTNEIDRVILELQGMRNMLSGEGERLSRQIADYARLNHAAMTAMKVIAESLEQWKGADPTRSTGGTPTDHAMDDHVIALPSRAS